MSIPRLLVLLVLTLACVAPAGAQSSEKSSGKDAVPQPAEGLNLPRTTPAAPATGDDTINVRTASRLLQHVLAQEQNSATCYSIRLYRVKRDDPESDTTRAAGYSICQPSARFQVKTAVDSIEIAPR
jgi:hypothetical protein